MNKTLLLLLGGGISLLALIVLFFGDDIDSSMPAALSTQPQALETQGQSHHSGSDVSIAYSTTIAASQEDHADSIDKAPKRPTLEPFMEARTLDKSRTFEISLINSHKDSTRATGKYQTLQGTVDGEPFSLKVPQHLIDEGTGVTELRIKNLKTGETSSVAAAFIDDMKDPAVKQKIEVDSGNIENFQQSSRKQVSPLLPGERRE